MAALSKVESTVAELEANRWAVISFDRCEATGLTFDEARARLAELENQHIAGLCIVTDEVAARLRKH